MSSSRPPRSRPLRLARAVLLRLALVLLGLAAAELCVRLVLAAAGRPHDAVALRALLRERLALAPAERQPLPLAAGLPPEPELPHPFAGFDTERQAAVLEGWLAALADDPGLLRRDFSVLVLGGSVAELFADPGSGGLAPLRERLRDDPRARGREILFLGQGRAAYKEPQQLTWFCWLLALGVVPELVIEIDGFNELAIAALNAADGAHPLYPMAHRWATAVAAAQSQAYLEHAARVLAARRLAARFLDAGLERSAVLDVAVRALLADLDRGGAEARRAVLDELSGAGGSRLLGPPFRGTSDDALALAVASWAEGSRALHALCREHGIAYLHVLQPTLHDAGSKPLSDEERAAGAFPPAVERAVREGYPLLRAEGQRLAAEGIPFLDASRVFAGVEETLYVDGCHFRAPGHALLGRAIAGAL